MGERTDKVWVGNLGAYNEGRLVGDWLELPYDEDSLGEWLREHVGIGKPSPDGYAYEEYEVFDTDLAGSLGRIGAQARDLGRCGLDQLNALARIAEGLTEGQVEAAMACLEANGTGRAIEAANAMLQVDEVAFTPFPRSRPDLHHYSSEAQALDWSGVLDVPELSDKTLMGYVDPTAVGEDEEQFGVFGADVFVNTTASEEPVDMDREDIIAMAGRTGSMTARRRDGESLETVTEEARSFLKDHRLLPSYTHKEIDRLLEEDPELGIACADVVADMDVACPEAVCAYFDGEVSATTPKALAELILQADRVAYTKLEGARKWDESQWDADIRRLGEAVIGQRGDTFSREELERYFDGERYAQDLLDAGELTVTEHGVLDNNATDVDLGKHPWDEVIEASREIGDSPEEDHWHDGGRPAAQAIAVAPVAVPQRVGGVEGIGR